MMRDSYQYRTRRKGAKWIAEHRKVGSFLWRKIRLAGYALTFDDQGKAQFMVEIHKMAHDR